MDSEDEMIVIDSPPHGDEDGNGLKRANAEGYVWEEEYKRSWDVLQEDENGMIATSVAQLSTQLKRKRLLRDTRTLHRGLVRHLVVVVDMSESMLERDLKPSRSELAQSTLDTFVIEYFDQNPLSQVSLVTTRDEVAQLVSSLSSNPGEHTRALKGIVPSGAPSLQNALEVAMNTLAHVPSHGTREILVIFSALSTCDPGNILDTVAALKNQSIRVSVVCMSAEIRICKKVSTETHGKFAVALNEHHFKDLVLESVPPPPIAVKSMIRQISNIMRMGFPERITQQLPTLCACHSNLTSQGYQCPVCGAKVCTVPTDCVTCGLTLVLSPHLARSYHHLFPVPNFIEITDWDRATSDHCTSCLSALPQRPSAGESLVAISRSQPTGRFECPKCHGQVCIDCDVYIHEVLHNCPNCFSMGQG